MLFRIVFIGKTGMHKEIRESALEMCPVVCSGGIGTICPDDFIDVKVDNVEAGKAVMKHIYQQTKNFPKWYAYTEKDSFWVEKKDNGNTISVFEPDAEIHADRYDYVKPCVTEHFEDFLVDMVKIPKETYDQLIATCHRAAVFGLDVVSEHIDKKSILDDAMKAMQNYVDSDDPETAHSSADGILVNTLDKLGFQELTALYGKVEKWYA